MTSAGDVLLPEGARLVHIGPHKTGTTTLQGAFHLARAAAAKQGVHYAGPNRQPVHAAQALVANSLDPSREPAALRPWRRLVDDVERATATRVVISSEWFAELQPAGIRMLVDAFDPARVHVAVTLRPLGRILASQWQQFAQAGHSIAFDAWLKAIFDDPTSTTGALFWQRHRHDELIDRWAAEVGHDRLTVVVADDRDRDFLLRSFERLVGLRSHTLEAPDDRENRSLTKAETEVVRFLHPAMREHDLDASLRLRIALFAVAGNLKLRVPDANEPRIETPSWAFEASAEVARQAVDRIRSTGVRVIGDLDSLVTTDPGRSNEAVPLTNERWAAINASAAMGVLGVSGLARGSTQASNSSDGWPDELDVRPSRPGDDRAQLSYDSLSTTRLVTVLAARMREVAAARLGLRRLRRRSKRRRAARGGKG